MKMQLQVRECEIKSIDGSVAMAGNEANIRIKLKNLSHEVSFPGKWIKEKIEFQGFTKPFQVLFEIPEIPPEQERWCDISNESPTIKCLPGGHAIIWHHEVAGGPLDYEIVDASGERLNPNSPKPYWSFKITDAVEQATLKQLQLSADAIQMNRKLMIITGIGVIITSISVISRTM